MEQKNLEELLRGLTAAVLFLVILLLVIFSAKAYQHAVDVQDDNDNLRAVLSYVVTAANADRADTVSVEIREGKQVLVILDERTGTEQRIFFLNGEILEDNGLVGSKIYPEDAVVMGKVDRFELEQIKEDLIRVDTDLGSSYIHTH